MTDEMLVRVFGKYPSFQKAKVVRDKRTNKTKGFGFVSFKDPQDFIKAMKEMNGESYIYSFTIYVEQKKMFFSIITNIFYIIFECYHSLNAQYIKIKNLLRVFHHTMEKILHKEM